MQGIGPERLRIRELVTRLADEQVQEIILAMDPNLEGEATATYLSRLLNPIGVTVSRLASGLPVGGDLEYADEITLGRALEGRRILTAGQRRTEPDAALPTTGRTGPGQTGSAGQTASEPVEEGVSGPAGNRDGVRTQNGADGDDATGTEAGKDGGSTETGTGSTPRTAPVDPYRRYPTPRRGEDLANPWSD